MKLIHYGGVLGSALFAALACGDADEPVPLEFEKSDHVIEVPGGEVHAWEVALKTQGAAAPVVIFLHGGTWSGRPNFDLEFQDYSTMEHFASAGWDTFAFDARGYGESSNPEGDSWSEAADAVKDLHIAVERIRKLRSVKRVHFVGWSWGSQLAALFAQTYPDLTARVVLYGTRWQPLDAAFEVPDEPFRKSTADDAKADFVPGCFDPALVEAYAKAAIAADPDSPNGVFRDYFVGLPIIDPKKCACPTLIISGEHEAEHAIEDMIALFRALSSWDKQLAVIPGGGHAVHFEQGRHRWRSTVLAFLSAASAQ